MSGSERDIVERLRELKLTQVLNHTAAKWIDEAAAEIERLRERLEMTHAWQMIDGKMTRVSVELGSIPDGIDCRDETIRLQDKHIERLRQSKRRS